MPNQPLTSPHASAGLSVSVGMSTKFAAQKIEVAVWCTLPCEATESEIALAYDRAATMVLTEADARLAQAGDRFFPELWGAG